MPSSNLDRRKIFSSADDLNLLVPVKYQVMEGILFYGKRIYNQKEVCVKGELHKKYILLKGNSKYIYLMKNRGHNFVKETKSCKEILYK